MIEYTLKDGTSVLNIEGEEFTQVCKSMNLSPSQQGSALELWQSFHLRIGKLMDVRRSIHKHMQSTMPDGVFGRSFAINFLKVHLDIS